MPSPASPREGRPHDPASTLTVWALPGSLRRASYNRALLLAARDLAPPGMTVHLFEGLADVPLYNGDVEAAGDPPGVTALKAAIRGADALLIATPEYNHSVPGVLKNAIGWASRPPRGAVLAGKPTGLLGTSPGMTGTARAQSVLRQSFVFTQTPTMLQPEYLLGRAHEKFDEAGHLTDEASRRYLQQYLMRFQVWVHTQQRGA